MSSAQDIEGLERRGSDDGKDKKDGKGDGPKDSTNNVNRDGDAVMKDAEPEDDEILDEETLGLTTEDLKTRKRLLENDARIMKSEFQRLSHEKATMGERIKENNEKIANNRFVSLDAITNANHPANFLTGNYPILLATLSSCWILTPPPNPSKKAPISILTLRE